MNILVKLGNILVKLLLVIVAVVLVIIVGTITFVIYSVKYTLQGKVGDYWHNVAVSLDQTGASLYGWDKDVTISERMGLEIVHNRANWFIKLMCEFLNLFDHNHCEKQAKKYYEELEEECKKPRPFLTL